MSGEFDNVTMCIDIKRILRALRFHSQLKIDTDKNDQNIFNEFTNSVYNTSDIIMDYYHLEKISIIERMRC